MLELLRTYNNGEQNNYLYFQLIKNEVIIKEYEKSEWLTEMLSEPCLEPLGAPVRPVSSEFPSFNCVGAL